MHDDGLSDDLRAQLDAEDDPTAQDVIDALRFVSMAQKSPGEMMKLLNALLEMAPETDGDRGIKLITDLIVEGSLKVEMADA